MRLGYRAKPNVIAFGADPAYVRYGKKKYAPTRFEDDPICIKAVGCGAVICRGRDLLSKLGLLAHSLNGSAEPLVGKRLQEIIHRVHFESAHRILVVRRRKDDVGRRRFRL